MKRGRRLQTWLATGAVGCAMVVVQPSTSTAGQAPVRQQANDVTRTVTLITGDTISVTTTTNGKRVIRSMPGPGRRKVAFTEYEYRGRLHVTPSDAEPLLAAQQLDPRLFDVSTLLEQRQETKPWIPLIATYGPAAKRSAARSSFTAVGAKVTRDFGSLGSAALRAPKTTSAWQGLQAALRGGGVRKLWLDGIRRPSLDRSTTQIGAPAAWSNGYTGAGVKVAVLDTGVDATHPDLADRVKAEQDFTGSGPGDQDGHGTHVASTIAGTGAASGGSYRGVADGSDLAIAKVCDLSGCPESAILAGMQWAAVDQRAKVLNLSLGGPDTPGTDPLEAAVEALTKQTGALFVIAAGNGGVSGAGPVSSPGSVDSALTVGAVDRSDQLQWFSNRGTRAGDGAIKPDLSGPGLGIVAARADGTGGMPGDDQYIGMSGTSMATPHVAGAAALLAQQHPGWSGDEIKSALVATAKPATPVQDNGAGRVDVESATRLRVLPSPASIGLPTQVWPRDDEQPISRTITYHNPGTVAVTLDLVADGIGPGNHPAPAGMFKLSTAAVTVPAGGRTSVVLTTDPRLGTVGSYSGQVVGSSSSGPDVVRTPVGLVIEPELFDLTIDSVDRAGKPSKFNFVFLTDLATGTTEWLESGDAPIVKRLPRGQYDLLTVIATYDSQLNSTSSTLVSEPGIDLAADRRITLDARKGRPARAVVDRPGAQPHVRRVGVTVGQINAATGTDRPDFGVYATPTKQVSYPFRYQQWASLTEPDRNDGGLTHGYNLHRSETGRIPEPAYTVHDGELGAVRRVLHKQGRVPPAGETLSFSTPVFDGEGRSMWYPVTAGTERLDFFTSSTAGVNWYAPSVGTAEQTTLEYGQSFSVTPGERRVEHWGRAALGAKAFGKLSGAGFSPNVWSTSSPDPGHYGIDYAAGVTEHTELTRDGVLAGENDDRGGGLFELPGGKARYVLKSRIQRAVPWSEHSTEVDTRWTFTAEPAADGESAYAPMLRHNLTAPVDLTNRAARTALPLTLRGDRAQTDVPIQSGGLDISFDDGKSWRKVPLRKAGDSFHGVTPAPPLAAEFVSVRTTVTDAAGRAVESTIIRAYGLH